MSELSDYLATHQEWTLETEFKGTETDKGQWECARWEVRVRTPHRVEEFYYFTGIGWSKVTLPSSRVSQLVSAHKFAHSVSTPLKKKILEHHRIPLTVDNLALAAVEFTPPTLADVIHTLASEARAMDQGFEDWAVECGYDPDSRKAERIYYACREQGQRALRLFGAEELRHLQTLDH